ncbi:single-stranded DNA-binding protein [Nocardioides daphniae]|uniref:Single-stranded DNA-binding protein n=1 Tax=Nocardioides daphniae TaxID=402297 RepID=A0A4P7UBU5_9ACTN|nr:single-stranded DNA-binding protein [Nocardioides daphniae]QCC76785.1 single-stranded DNA-binding protein [Nocardioides daphniae]GGD16474.1 hypothetical protein GCM10007231_14260 [Nocardioides daphniae]
MNDDLITFSGWVGSRVELTQVRGEVPLASFRVGSTPRRLRDGRWENGETIWYAVKAWRHLAANVAASVSSGDPVLVTGRFTAETWQKEDGTTVTRHVVVAQSVGHDLSKGTSTFVRPATAAVSSREADEQAPVDEHADAVGVAGEPERTAA